MEVAGKESRDQLSQTPSPLVDVMVQASNGAMHAKGLLLVGRYICGLVSRTTLSRALGHQHCDYCALVCSHRPAPCQPELLHAGKYCSTRVIGPRYGSDLSRMCLGPATGPTAEKRKSDIAHLSCAATTLRSLSSSPFISRRLLVAYRKQSWRSWHRWA